MVVEIISIVMNQRFRDFQTVQNSITKKKNKNNQEIERAVKNILPSCGATRMWFCHVECKFNRSIRYPVVLYLVSL